MVSKKVLIVYDSGFGSTAEIANAIAAELFKLKIPREVMPVELARAPQRGEAVIIGSPIRYDKWLPTVRDYVNHNQIKLSEVPVAYFYTCLALVKNPSCSFNTTQIYDNALLKMNPMINPIMIAGFSGTLRPEIMPWYYRYPLKWLAKFKGVSTGDYRDWSMIKNWTNQFVSHVVHPTKAR